MSLMEKFNKLKLDVEQQASRQSLELPASFGTLHPSDSFWSTCLTPDLSSADLNFNFELSSANQEPASQASQTSVHNAVHCWLDASAEAGANQRVPSSGPPPATGSSTAPIDVHIADLSTDRKQQQQHRFRSCSSSSSTASAVSKQQRLECGQNPLELSLRRLEIADESPEIVAESSSSSLLEQLKTRGYRTMINQRLGAPHELDQAESSASLSKQGE